MEVEFLSSHFIRPPHLVRSRFEKEHCGSEKRLRPAAHALHFAYPMNAIRRRTCGKSFIAFVEASLAFSQFDTRDMDRLSERCKGAVLSAHWFL